MAITCRQCKTPNRDGARFCSSCGASLVAAPAAAYVPLQPGQRMKGGAFQVVNPLGKGGMGAAYLAEQVIAGQSRHVVIKEMLDYWDPADPLGREKARRQFETEAATLVVLNHAGIPQIYDYFSDGGRNYIVMQFIEGKNLEERLADSGALPVEQVIRWGIYPCRVLAYLSAQRPPVIHHDIKPANLILDKATDEVRLVDFGTAKARLLAQQGGRVGVQKSSIFGTAGYAAPEMYRQFSEHRSDVYALAATLYHLLTNDDPRDHPFDFPQSGGLAPEIGRSLQFALEQDHSRRATAAQFQAQLEGSLSPVLFTFAQRDVARTDSELAHLCDAYWTEAQDHLYQGVFESRFHNLGRGDLLQKVQAARACKHRDEGLEQFVRFLDPNLQRPNLRIQPDQVDFGAVSERERKVQTVTLINATRGWLRADVRPVQTWITAFPDQVELLGQHTKSLTITLLGERIPLRGRLTAKVNIVVHTVTQPGQVEAASTEQVVVHARTSVASTLFKRHGPPLAQGLLTSVRWLGSLVLAFVGALLAQAAIHSVWDVQYWDPAAGTALLAAAGGIAGCAGVLLGSWRWLGWWGALVSYLIPPMRWGGS